MIDVYRRPGSNKWHRKLFCACGSSPTEVGEVIEDSATKDELKKMDLCGNCFRAIQANGYPEDWEKNEGYEV